MDVLISKQSMSIFLPISLFINLVFLISYLTSSSKYALYDVADVNLKTILKETMNENCETNLLTDIGKTSNVRKCDTLRSNITNWSLNYWSGQPDAKEYGCRPAEIIDWALMLRKAEKKIYSQNGEDGVIDAIFKKIGVTSRFFVEFGVQSGMECNTRALREKDWKGVMFDNMNHNPMIGLYRESVWIDNVVPLFQKYHIPLSFDLFSLDTDFGDFWVLRELMLAGYRPRVIVLEVNRAYGPYASFTIPKMEAANHGTWQQNRWFGASVQAFEKLMHKFGYQLVYIEKVICNAFFIKRSEINNIELARVFWQRKLFEGASNYAHVEDTLNRPFEHICEMLPCDSSDDW